MLAYVTRSSTLWRTSCVCTSSSRSVAAQSRKSTNSNLNLKRSLRSIYTNSAEKTAIPTKYGHGKKGRMAKEAELQMKQDSKISQKELPQTGPGSGSLRSRSTESERSRYPPHFLGRTKRLEAEAPVHLEAIKQHFTQTLDLQFEDWELVQTALTHYSYIGARKTNDALSRLGEKALRFILVTELQSLEPATSKQAWFLTTNLRFMCRFEFLATFVENSMNLTALTRFTPPAKSEKKLRGIYGKENQQFRHSIVSKSILAVIGVIYQTKGEAFTRSFVRTLFVDPYRDETGRFVAPVLQPMQVAQTGGL